MRQHSRGRACLAAAAALCAVAVTPEQVLAAPADGIQDLPVYQTADGATKVTGEKSSADAQEIKPGIYTDTIAPGDRLYYSVILDARSGVLLSAVAAPGPGSAVAYGDGIDVSLQKTGGRECTRGRAQFGVSGQARPIADYAGRTIEEDGDCQEQGPYHFVIERTSDPTSDPDPWPVEIRYMSEPGLKDAVPTAPPTGWNSASPSPPTGQGQTRRGGTGFNDARALDEGVWKDELRPGETRFYRVPLHWGQQLSTSAELANATMTEDSGYASGGLGLELYNTARGRVDDQHTGYDGKGAAVSSGPTAPVAYNNRFDTSDEVSMMPFAGWYYLAVRLGTDVGEFTKEPVPLTLRLTIDGEPQPGPRYDGDAVAAGFGVTDNDREAAEKGQTAGESEKSGTMRLVGAAGIGAGTVLLLGLGVWTLVARRRALVVAAAPTGAAGPQQAQPYPHTPVAGPQNQQYGPPPRW